jgi:hypothetical protein
LPVAALPSRSGAKRKAPALGRRGRFRFAVTAET